MFSVLESKSGSYQIEVEEADKPKIHLCVLLGFLNLTGCDQRARDFSKVAGDCMGDMHLREVLVFLDNLTLEEHEAPLMRFLGRLEEFGLKLSP